MGDHQLTVTEVAKGQLAWVPTVTILAIAQPAVVHIYQGWRDACRHTASLGTDFRLRIRTECAAAPCPELLEMKPTRPVFSPPLPADSHLD